jgi:hypothetical protein
MWNKAKILRNTFHQGSKRSIYRKLSNMDERFEEDINKKKDIQHSWIERINIVIIYHCKNKKQLV